MKKFLPILILLAGNIYSEENPAENKKSDEYEKQVDIQILINRGLEKNFDQINEKARGMSYEKKDYLFYKNKKEAALPFVLNLFIGMGIGSFVQKDTGFAVMTLVGELGSFSVMMVGSYMSDPHSSIYNSSYALSDSLLYGGALLYTIFHIAELIRPWVFANNYNNNLRDALRLVMNVQPTFHFAWFTREPVYGAVLTGYF